jgi:hypothetical protein
MFYGQMYLLACSSSMLFGIGKYLRDYYPMMQDSRGNDSGRKNDGFLKRKRGRSIRIAFSPF